MKTTKTVPGQAVFSMCHLLTLYGEPDAVQVSLPHACQLGQSVGLSGRKRSGGAGSWSICPLFFFFSFFLLFFFSLLVFCVCWLFFSFFLFPPPPFLCFAKVGFGRGNCHWAHVMGGRAAHRRGSTRVYVLSVFSCSFYLADPVISCFLLAGPDLCNDSAKVRKHCLRARE